MSRATGQGGASGLSPIAAAENIGDTERIESHDIAEPTTGTFALDHLAAYGVPSESWFYQFAERRSEESLSRCTIRVRVAEQK